MALRWPGVHTKSYDEQFRHMHNTASLRGCSVLLIRGICDVCYRYSLRWSANYMPSFMMIGTRVQTVLKLCLRNMRGCKYYRIQDGFIGFALAIWMAGIMSFTDGWNLWSMVFRWLLWHCICTKCHEDWYKHSSNIKV